MRIGIDARFYGPPGKGIGRYLEKLISQLENLDPENKYFIFLRQENFDLYKPQNQNFHKILVNYPWYSWQEQILLPIQLKKYRLDIVHFPNFNVSIFYSGKFVLTIHDLTLLNWSTKRDGLGRFFYELKNLIFRLVLKRAILRAEKIITVSEHSRQKLIEKFNLSRDKVEAIHLAA